jgi:pterin-4a-carbinolamine dehydratase
MRFAQFNEHCWTGYRQSGMKNKSGRQVPNCVPVTENRRDPADLYKPTDSELDRLHHVFVPAWSLLDHDQLTIQYDFVDDDTALEFVQQLDDIEQQLDHNAVITLDNARVTVTVRTSDVDGLTRLDFEFALRTHALAQDLSGDPVPHATNQVDEANSRIARKPGQPAHSKKHSDLYTDENPKGTITGLKFATADDARASVAKIRSSGRSHAHKIQAAVAMEQRARAAGKTEAASVYRRYIDASKKTESLDMIEENLRDWFKDKWVRFGPDGKIRGDCARGSESEGKPKCLPQSKAHALGKKGRASAAARKRRQDPDANRSGAAINVSTKGKKK